LEGSEEEKKDENILDSGTIRPRLFKKPEIHELRLRNGERIEVEYLGDDYYGTYNGKQLWCPIYSHEAIRKLADEIKYAIAHDWDQPIVIAGRERSGKSDFAMHLIHMLDPNFKLDNVAFTQEEFREKVDGAKFYDIIWMDEAGEALLSHEWMYREQRDLVKAFLKFGIKKLTTILILPHIKLLNKQLRDRRVWWWIEVYATDLDRRGFAQVRKAPLKQNPFDTEIFWNGVFTIRYPSFKKMDPKKWEQYEKMKLEFLERQETPSGESHERPSATMMRLHTAVKRLSDEGVPIKDIARLFGYSRNRISEILGEKRAKNKDKT